MKLRGDWFNSTELKVWLDESEEGVEIEELTDFFSEVFNLFEPDEIGRPLLDYLTEDWDLFSEAADPSAIVMAALDICGIGLTPDSVVRYSDDVMFPVNNWNDIKEELRTNRRFLMDSFIDDRDDNWKWFFTANDHLPQGAVYYRGRTNKEKDKPFVDEKDLTAPKPQFATPGRVNTYGIPHLYLTDSPETVIYELRSVTGDQISIGEFEIDKDLDVLNFTKREDLYDLFASENYDSLFQAVQRQVLLTEISKDMSRPVRRYDDPNLDYLPTQLVCEYIRIKKQEDGIIFESSQKGAGRQNIVLFDKRNAHMIRSFQRTVGEIEMKFEE